MDKEKKGPIEDEMLEKGRKPSVTLKKKRFVTHTKQFTEMNRIVYLTRNFSFAIWLFQIIVIP